MALSWALPFTSWAVAEAMLFKMAAWPAVVDTLDPKAEKNGVGIMC